MNMLAFKIKEKDKQNLVKKKEKKKTPLHKFCEKGWKVEVEKIISKVDLNEKDYYDRTPLDIAKEKKHLEIIELIENQIEINNRLFKAMENKNIEKMLVFMDLGANLNLRNENSYMPIHLSIFWEDTKALEKLIEMKVDLNAKDEKGWTPLMIAANYGKIKHFNLLLKHNVKTDVEDNFGWTALELARDRIMNIGLQIQEELDIITEILEK